MSEEENKLRELAEKWKDTCPYENWAGWIDNNLTQPESILSLLDTITQLRRENEIMKKALEYITMPHNEFQNKTNDSVEIMSELANQRLFDISEAKKALKDCEEL
jgi:hypothetical protein